VCNGLDLAGILCGDNVSIQEYQGLFIESSAKDGKNVLEAVTELSR